LKTEIAPNSRFSTALSEPIALRSINFVFGKPFLLWTFIAVLASVSAIEGWALRRWVWDITDPLRFTPDTERHCYWALETTGPEGFLNQYEKMAIQTRRWDIFLDYVPLRLLVMQRWGVYLRSHFPDIASDRPENAYQRSYEFSAPLLRFNAAMDGLAAICAFFVTRHWVRQGRSNQYAGIWQGLIAGLLIWFNPAILLSAYAWPTWDSWIIPMFLLAALLASMDWWFCSGVALAIGAMLKGQQLAIAPVFVLWPLLQGRVGASFKWCIGLLFGMAIIASPWLVTYLPADALNAARQVQQTSWPVDYPSNLFAISRAIDWPAILWIVGILSVISLAPKFLRRFSYLTAAAIFLAVTWPWFLSRNHSSWPLSLFLAGMLIIAVLKLRPSRQPFILAATAGASLLLCMSLFHASNSWWTCGFVFGADRWHWFAETLTDNLPGLLLERYGWSKDPDVIIMTLAAIPRHWPTFLTRWQYWPAVTVDLTAKTVFNTIYIVMLLVSCIGVSLQARRNDRRMLLALVTPWLVFFVFPAEVHGRYSLFFAGISAICIGESIGMFLLNLFFTALATIHILDDLLQAGDASGWSRLLWARYPNLFSYDCADRLYRFLEGTHPDLAWALFLATGIFLYQSFKKTSDAGSEVLRRAGFSETIKGLN
jgi:hypothetical protein